MKVEEADEDGWIKWEPKFEDYDAFPDINPDTKVEVELRNSVSGWGAQPANKFEWSNEDYDFDIVKYRIVKD